MTLPKDNMLIHISHACTGLKLNLLYVRSEVKQKRNKQYKCSLHDKPQVLQPMLVHFGVGL
jgi:hypothetical protein